MSKCIDTIESDSFRDILRGWLGRLFRSDLIPGEAVKPAEPDQSGPAPAPAMLMTSRDTRPLLARSVARIAVWQTRRSSRRQLLALDDRQLKDIGISRCDAEQEYRKPFWRR